MKEYNATFDNIFKGLEPKEGFRKDKVMLSECHNLEPVGDDYKLHELVIDLNSATYDFGSSGQDIWQDDSDDDWIDHDDDVFEDN
jgi:hypothetical protein